MRGFGCRGDGADGFVDLAESEAPRGGQRLAQVVRGIAVLHEEAQIAIRVAEGEMHRHAHRATVRRELATQLVQRADQTEAGRRCRGRLAFGRGRFVLHEIEIRDDEDERIRLQGQSRVRLLGSGMPCACLRRADGYILEFDRAAAGAAEIPFESSGEAVVVVHPVAATDRGTDSHDAHGVGRLRAAGRGAAEAALVVSVLYPGTFGCLDHRPTVGLHPNLSTLRYFAPIAKLLRPQDACADFRHARDERQRQDNSEGQENVVSLGKSLAGFGAVTHGPTLAPRRRGPRPCA